MEYFWKDNPILTTQIDDFFKQLAFYNSQNFDSKITILLLGSMSRGEATWIEYEGSARIISDLEFFTIYPDGFNKQIEFNNLISQSAKKCFKNQDSVLFHIDNTWISRSELSRLPRKVLTFDAKNMGKVVFGDQLTLDCIPISTLENINREDIWDIIVHRLFYVLYYGGISRKEGKDKEYRYTIAKNSLDLMTVLLASYNILNTGFYNKLEAIKKTSIDEEYKRYFEYCLSIKLNVDTEYSYSINEMERIFISLIKYCKQSFHVGISNRVLNAKFIFKRRLGIIKRMIRLNQITFGRGLFLEKLINIYDNKEELNQKLIKESYILNGYPNS